MEKQSQMVIKSMKFILGLFFITVLFTNQTIKAQNAEETGNQLFVISEGEELDDRIITRRDVNGRIASAILIQSDIPGLSFSSNNGVIDVVEEGSGSYLVYLSPGERVIEIFSSSHLPLKIILYDYGINLREGKAWQLKVSGDKPVVEIPVNIRVLNVNTDELMVYVNGELVDHTKPVMIEKGQHNFTIKSNGYYTISESVEVSDAQNLFEYSLKLIPLVRIAVKSDPTNAIVYLNGRSLGETDSQFFAEVGRHEIKLAKAGFEDYIDTIQVIDGAENEFYFNLNRDVGFLQLNLTPADATVKVDGVPYTGQPRIPISPGRHILEISKTGYKSEVAYVSVEKGRVHPYTLILEPYTGILVMDVNNQEARSVLRQINGSFAREWIGINRFNKMPVGRYSIEVTLDGYKPFKEEFEISQDEPTELNYRFDRNRLLASAENDLNNSIEQAKAELARQKAAEAARNNRNNYSKFRFGRNTSDMFYVAMNSFTFNNNRFRNNVTQQYGAAFGWEHAGQPFTFQNDFIFQTFELDRNYSINGISYRRLIMVGASASLNFQPDMFNIFMPYGGIGYHYSFIGDDGQEFSEPVMYQTRWKYHSWFYRFGALLDFGGWGFGLDLRYGQDKSYPWSGYQLKFFIGV